ncbi:MAG TPA: isoamylase early set domain-containing protein, partial [Candidatus Krumholzibacteria bacterium]|nr:isoamylase early set domain-containing protein [Candidatus Krumholzibacteria bacterium]
SSTGQAPEIASPSAQFSQDHSALKVMEQPRTETASLVSGGSASNAGNFRVVHLIYAPRGDDLKSVTVAGSFNGWNANSLPMQKVGGVWTMNLVLPPGAYEYMFVEDGKHWVTDPLAPFTRDDGFGNRNAVLQLGA